MAIVTLPTIGPDPTSITSSVLNGKVDPLATDYNGNIQNANIASGAGIVYSKLSLTDGIVNADINSSAAIAATKLNLTTITQTIAYSGVATNWAKGSDIASATTTDIGAATGNCVDVTGTTTITGLGTVQAGTTRFVRFTGVLTLTHNATSLILPTGANITTAAGDTAIFESLGSGNWVCLVFQRKDGTSLTAFNASTAPAGTVLQVVNTIVTSAASGTTAIPIDDSIPQNTEGTEIMTRAITPNSTSNKLKIEVVAQIGLDGGDHACLALYQDSTANALAAAPYFFNTNEGGTVSLIHYMDAGTTSSTTFKVRTGTHNGNTFRFNGINGSGRKFGGVCASSITITEIKA